MATRKERALALMQTWCDALLAYQVEEFSTEYLHGSLLCPACHIIHGRCADLAYPLVTLWAQTGREAYLRAAVELVDWTEANLVCEGGGYRNDAGNRWTGITAFSAMSLAEALLHYGDRLDSALRERWLNIFARLCGYMIHFLYRAKSQHQLFRRRRGPVRAGAPVAGRRGLAGAGARAGALLPRAF